MSVPPSASHVIFSDVTAGTLVCLAAEGAFNQYVTCNPTKTHFPGQVYQRHTHFAVAHVYLPVENKPGETLLWPDNYTVRAKIGRGRIGDLLGKVLFCTRYNRGSYQGVVKVATGVGIGYVDNTAFAQILETRMLVGNNILEKHSGEALYIMDQLGYNGKGVDASYGHGSVPNVLGSALDPGAATTNKIADEQQLRLADIAEFSVNLQFHMGRGDRPEDILQNAWPLVSTQYQDIVFETDLRAKVDLIRGTTGTYNAIDNATLITDVLTKPYGGGPDTPASGSGHVELLDMYYCLQTIFLTPAERSARAKARDERMIKYVDVLATHRFNANDSVAEFKLESENNTSDYLVFVRRNNASHVSAKQYFDFSVNVNDDLVPDDLDNDSGAITYWPRNPMERITMLANNNVIFDGSAQHFHINAPLMHHYNKIPKQFICTIPRTLAPHVQHEHYGSQADSRIDNLTMRVQLARNNASGTGINQAGTIYVLGTKYSRVIIDKGQVGIEFPTH